MSNVLKALATSVLVVMSVFGQSGPSGTPVVVSDGPPAEFYTRFVYTTGTSTWVCISKHYNELSTITQTSISNATPAVIAATAHGLHPDASPQIVITGATGSWVSINGTFTATVINANSFSIPVNTTSFGAVAGTVVIKTNAARTSRPIWAVSKSVDDSATSGRLSVMTAVGGYSSICDNRTTLSFQ